MQVLHTTAATHAKHPVRRVANAANIFRVKVRLASGQRFAFTGLFSTSTEAILQAHADHPDARSIAALCVRRAA